MGRRSAIEVLEPHVRSAVDELIDSRASIDKIVARLRLTLGADAPSRSAVGRYAKSRRARVQEEATQLAALLHEVRQLNQRTATVLERLDTVVMALGDVCATLAGRGGRSA